MSRRDKALTEKQFDRSIYLTYVGLDSHPLNENSSLLKVSWHSLVTDIGKLFSSNIPTSSAFPVKTFYDGTVFDHQLQSRFNTFFSGARRLRLTEERRYETQEEGKPNDINDTLFYLHEEQILPKLAKVTWSEEKLLVENLFSVDLVSRILQVLTDQDDHTIACFAMVVDSLVKHYQEVPISKAEFDEDVMKRIIQHQNSYGCHTLLRWTDCTEIMCYANARFTDGNSHRPVGFSSFNREPPGVLRTFSERLMGRDLFNELCSLDRPRRDRPDLNLGINREEPLLHLTEHGITSPLGREADQPPYNIANLEPEELVDRMHIILDGYDTTTISACALVFRSIIDGLGNLGETKLKFLAEPAVTEE